MSRAQQAKADAIARARVERERRKEGPAQQKTCATPGCQEVADCGSYCTDHMFARLGGE